ncbi:MAG: hypothetical protein Q7J07_09500 [Pelolinea sp.]|nr:hypothetical protein [Pelolinea sp.]
MRKFFIKILIILLTAGALFVWFCTDARVLAGANALGMDDSSDWIAVTSQNPDVMDTLEAAQVSMLQVTLPWGEIELSPGAYAWAIDRDGGYTDFNALFSRLTKRGVEPVVVLSGGPTYLSNLYPQQPVYRDQFLVNWENYVRAAVQQFGDEVDYWQIGGVINDPTQWGKVVFPGAVTPSAAPDPDLYGEMLRIAYGVIKSAQASDTVLLGELIFADNCAYHPINYLQTLIDLNLWSAFDVISLTLPELNEVPEKAVIDTCGIMPIQSSGIPGADSLRAAADAAELAGDKPLWVHGLRFSNGLLAGEAAKRGTLVEVIASDLLARASGLYLSYGKADRMFWSLDPVENTPGLIALQTFANLSRTLGGRFEGSSLPINSDAFALRFRGSGKLSLLAWYSQGGEEALPMVIDNVDGYDLHAFSADSSSLKNKDGFDLAIDAGGSSALLVSERPVLISGYPSDIKQTVTQTVEDSAAQASAGMQAKLQNWLQAQKVKAAASVGDWMAKQQASLLESLRSNFEQWMRKSLGLAKM